MLFDVSSFQDGLEWNLLVNFRFFIESSIEESYAGVKFYKSKWTHIKNETLFAKPYCRDEALEYDKFSIGIFKGRKMGEFELIGHAPLELSSLLHHFLKRKREIGLVVPALCN